MKENEEYRVLLRLLKDSKKYCNYMDEFHKEGRAKLRQNWTDFTVRECSDLKLFSKKMINLKAFGSYRYVISYAFTWEMAKGGYNYWDKFSLEIEQLYKKYENWLKPCQKKIK